jgi:hypothetical protein
LLKANTHTRASGVTAQEAPNQDAAQLLHTEGEGNKQTGNEAGEVLMQGANGNHT